MSYVEKKGLEVSVRRRDSGPRWILALHGLQSNQELFSELFTRPEFKDFSVLTLDFIGFGNSEKPPLFPYDLLQQAHRVVEILDAEKIPGVNVIGHSLGGMVATLLLRLVPHRVARLVSLEGNLTKLDCGESLRVSQLDFSTFKESYQGAVPDYVFYRTSKSIVAWSESDQLVTFFLNSAHPKLFLIGEKSAFHSRPAGPRVTLKNIPGAGHFLIQEKPEATWAEIETFLR